MRFMRILLVVFVGMMAGWGCNDSSKEKESKTSATEASKSTEASNAASKYAAKAKTTEAQQFLKKMSDSARSYYAMPNFDDSSLGAGVVAKQFPPSNEITPPLGTCCKDGGKCNPSSGNWEEPTWTALEFGMIEPHYYSYQFVNSKDSYTVLAYGDLDCDGEYSTFSLSGEVDKDGEVQSSDDFTKNKPLE